MYYTDNSMGENNECHLGTSWKIYTTCKDTNYGYKCLNIRSTFFLIFLGLVANTKEYICLQINIFLEGFCCHTAF